MASDPIQPAHYKGDYVMRVIEDFKLEFCLGNVVKYVLRADEKGGLEDLKKSLWYLEREIKNRQPTEYQQCDSKLSPGPDKSFVRCILKMDHIGQHKSGEHRW